MFGSVGTQLGSGQTHGGSGGGQQSGSGWGSILGSVVGVAAGIGYVAAKAALSAGAAGTYTVRPGDTLSKIAGQLLGSTGRWREIYDANGNQISDPNLIYPGMRLTIPGYSPEPTAPTAPTYTPPGQGGYYTVRSGDTLSAIAGNLMGDASRWREIYDANRNRIRNPNMLQVGWVLRIPGWSGGAPAPTGPQEPVGPESSATATDVRDIALQITTVMETSGLGGYAAINDYDAGIVSYGRHQATLASGALESLLDRYLANSNTQAAQALQGFMSRVRAKDPTLRNSTLFKDLLRQAANEPAMHAAQDAAIIQSHYNPAAAAAAEWNVKTPLGISMLYDTKIQGGMETVLARTRSRLGGQPGENGISELAFLTAFNDERRKRLVELAHGAGLGTSHGQALLNSTYRCDEFGKLLQSGNLHLVGEISVRGVTIQGLDPKNGNPDSPAVGDGPANSKRGQVMSAAAAHLGAPYSWGGDGPAVFDCSGYVLYVLRQDTGLISWPDDTAGGIANRLPATSNPKPGDLVFFTGSSGYVQHVEFVTGNGTQTLGASGGSSSTYGNDPNAKVQYGSWTNDSRPHFFRSISGLLS